jgi:hypothetical protein
LQSAYILQQKHNLIAGRMGFKITLQRKNQVADTVNPMIWQVIRIPLSSRVFPNACERQRLIIQRGFI